jgi:hypothetical protein
MRTIYFVNLGLNFLVGIIATTFSEVKQAKNVGSIISGNTATALLLLMTPGLSPHGEKT